jgi:hypothetical protein
LVDWLFLLLLPDQQKDEVDKDTTQNAKEAVNKVETELKQAQKDLEKKVEDNGVGDGVNQ